LSDLPLVEQVGGREVPLSFLSWLKRLQIGVGGGGIESLSTKRVTWLLVFLPQLVKAILGFNCTPDDFDFLSEYSEVLSGLSKGHGTSGDNQSCR